MKHTSQENASQPIDIIGPYYLSDLALLCDVKPETVGRYQTRGCIQFPRIGAGYDREYKFRDIVHIAVIVEMSRFGIPITNDGVQLSASLASMAVNGVEHVAVRKEEDGALDFWTDIQQGLSGGSCVVLCLGRIMQQIIGRRQRWSPSDNRCSKII